MSKNSETAILSGINQKGTIIEPKRTLTFPIPESIQNWNRLRFGIAFSLTDLVNPEAELANLSENQNVSDSTEASFFWCGLTSNSQGNLPFQFGTDDVFLGFGGTSEGIYTSGYRMNSNGNMFAPLAVTGFAAVTIKGSSQLHSNTSGLGSFSGRRVFNVVQNGQMSRFYNTSLSVFVFEFEINNRGQSNQSISLRGDHLTSSNFTGAPVTINYSDFSEESFVDAVGFSNPAGGVSNLHEGGDPLPIPQNIIFHWPFFDVWRLRLHGSLLIKGS